MAATRRFLYNPELDDYEGVSSRYEQSGRLELQLTYVMERRPRPKGTGERGLRGRGVVRGQKGEPYLRHSTASRHASSCVSADPPLLTLRPAPQARPASAPSRMALPLHLPLLWPPG